MILRAGGLYFYEGPGYWMSNFSSFAIRYESRIWMTVEHAYQASKFEDWELRDRIRMLPSAHQAFTFPRTHAEDIRPDWPERKLEVMEKLLRHKFAQHAYVRRKLRETGTRQLIEDSPKDGFWGRGSDWQGQNHLGRLWMKLRSELKPSEETLTLLDAANAASFLAEAGRFRVIVGVDSEIYQLGDDLTSYGEAASFAERFAKEPFQVYDDRGVPCV